MKIPGKDETNEDFNETAQSRRDLPKWISLLRQELANAERNRIPPPKAAFTAFRHIMECLCMLFPELKGVEFNHPGAVQKVQKHLEDILFLLGGFIKPSPSPKIDRESHDISCNNCINPLRHNLLPLAIEEIWTVIDILSKKELLTSALLQETAGLLQNFLNQIDLSVDGESNDISQTTVEYMHGLNRFIGSRLELLDKTLHRLLELPNLSPEFKVIVNNATIALKKAGKNTFELSDAKADLILNSHNLGVVQQDLYDYDGPHFETKATASLIEFMNSLATLPS